jgi:hypothetical protein
MHKQIITIVILMVVLCANFGYVSQGEEILNEEDIKTIQNDSIVPRKILYQSQDAINSINKQHTIPESLLTTNWDKSSFTDPLTFSRNISILLLCLFLIIQIVYTVMGKVTLKELSANFVTALIMQFGLLIILQLIIGISGAIGLFLNSIGKDFTTEALLNMMKFTSSSTNTIVVTKDVVGKLASVDYAKSNLTLEGFCLNTIQDQYRVMSLVFSWVYLLLVFCNWLVLLIADFVLSIALTLSPIIGITYMFGDKFKIVNKYWSIVLQASVTKILFYLIFALVISIQSLLRDSLTQSGVNLEYAIFCCFMLVALALSVFKVSTLFKSDNTYEGIITTLKKIQK